MKFFDERVEVGGALAGPCEKLKIKTGWQVLMAVPKLSAPDPEKVGFPKNPFEEGIVNCRITNANVRKGKYTLDNGQIAKMNSYYHPGAVARLEKAEETGQKIWLLLEKRYKASTDFSIKKVWDDGVVDKTYPSGLNKDKRVFSRLVSEKLGILGDNMELDVDLKKWDESNKIPIHTALRLCHGFLKEGEEFGHTEKGRRQMLVHELTAYKLMWSQISEKYGEHNKILFKNMPCQLPFKLTESQKAALKDIEHDLASGKAMYRLIQGDVGSGKTIVAFVAMLQAAMNGYQAALMAPYTTLARQHYLRLKELVEPHGFKVKWVGAGARMKKTGVMFQGGKIFSEKGDEDGYHFYIGTTALCSFSSQFKNLGLVVIDEQHRFGVKQRETLINKGIMCHVLTMSATPIPRTSFLSKYCGLKTSVLDKIAGRKDVKTRVADEYEDWNDVLEQVLKRLKDGSKAFWVCPFVEDTEFSELSCIATAEGVWQKLQRKLAGSVEVELLHGKMKAADKARALHNFEHGKAKILVASTIVEIGLDISAANVMIIQNAERFGLTTLHQLRGRVGRNEEQAECILLFSAQMGDNAEKRLRTLVDCKDGAAIAKIDMEMRGKGSVSGKKQSGDVLFKFGTAEEAEAIAPEETDIENLSSSAANFLTSMFRYQNIFDRELWHQKGEKLKAIRAHQANPLGKWGRAR